MRIGMGGGRCVSSRRPPHMREPFRSFLDRAGALLRGRRARTILIGSHVLAIALSFRVFHDERSPDRCTYRGLADGIAAGHYSYWNGLLDPAPGEVYRTHGYPVFLWAIRAVTKELLAVKVVQSLLHACAIALLLLLLARLRPGDVRAQNLLLLITLPDVPLLMYPQLLFPETLMEVLCVLLAWVAITRSGGSKWLLIGLLMAAAYWVRPVMALFPLLPPLADALFLRGAERRREVGTGLASAVLAIALGPLAFGWWNLSNHGIFNPLPLTGSSVVSNMGIWQLKLPGYGTMHYFRWTRFGSEIVSWADPDEAARNYVEYERQWRAIDSTAMLSATPQDTLALRAMIPHLDSLFATRSPQLTVAYDKVVAAANRRMILEDPVYYIASRAYTAVRLWITNINMPMDRTVWQLPADHRPVIGRPKGVSGWARAFAPFFTTLLLFGVGLPLLFRDVWRRRALWKAWRFPLLLITYVWLIHVPMSIQSRYMIPIHLLVFFCYALMLTGPKPGTTPRDQA